MTADRFSRNVIISLIGHFGVAALIFFRAMTVPNEPLNIRNAIRVDVVGLPKKMTEMPTKLEPPAPAPAPVAKPTPVVKETAPPVPPKVVPKPTVVLKAAKKPDTRKAEKNAMDKLKAMDAMEKFKAEMNKEKAPPAKAKPAPVIAGNQVAQGNSLTGLEKIEYDRYFDDIENKIHGNWSIPQWMADADFKASVQVLIDERGYVIKKIMRKSSGNEIFDAKVNEAIDNSSPLPPPPQRLRGVLSTSGIVFNFPQ